jgi:hypothetical protein
LAALTGLTQKTAALAHSFTGKPDMTVITDIHEDRRGQFWVATDENGLYLFDRKSGKVMRHFTPKSGLLSNGIDNIMEDSTGHLWLSNTLGLISLDIKTFAVKKYIKDNALPTNNLNWRPYQMPNGTVLYSTLTGFLRFRFGDLKPDPYSPQVHIEMLLHTDPSSLRPKTDTVLALVQKTSSIALQPKSGYL